MHVHEMCVKCPDYNRLDCFGVKPKAEKPNCYRCTPRPTEKIMVEIPFNVGQLFAFEHLYRNEKQFEVIKPRIVIVDNNDVFVECEFSFGTMRFEVERFEKLRELKRALTIEECKEKFPTCKYFIDEKEVDINRL